jgi:uncharacterized membrane protein
MAKNESGFREAQQGRSSAFVRRVRARTDLVHSLLGLLWSLGLVAAIWVAPLYTVDNGRAGVQLRVSLAAAGSTLGFVMFTAPTVAAVIVLALVAAPGSAAGNSRRQRAEAAVVVAAALLAAALVGFVTIIIGIYVMPAAIALFGRIDARPASVRRAQRRHQGG